MPDESRSRLKEWLASGAARLEPLSYPQREMWEASAVPPHDPSNHICVYMEVEGEVTSEECLAAVRLLVERHEVMRLSIIPGKNAPLQLIRKTATPAMEFSKLAPGESLEDCMREIFELPFDLVRGPLYRIRVIERGPADHVLVMPIHHAIGDGWTIGVFVENLAEAYLHVALKMPGSLDPVPLSYSAWAAAERAAWPASRLEECARYWRSRLADAPRLWEPIAVEDFRLERLVSAVPASLTAEVREAARRCNATLFTTLLRGFRVAMAEWTGQTDMVVGTPVANRTKQAVRETMGYCSGIVPIREKIDPSAPLDESVRTTHGIAMDAFANAMPFAELARALDARPSPGRNPIFDVRFALQNHPMPDTVAPGFSVKFHMRSTGTTRFELGCELTETGDGLEIVWLYRGSRFARTEIEELERLFLSALAPRPHHAAACLAAQ